MPTITFDKDYMELVLWEDAEGTEIVVNDIVDTSRWSNHYKLIFKKDYKYYQTFYSRGATESQDERPWEYEDKVECVEVEPYEKIVIEYRKV